MVRSKNLAFHLHPPFVYFRIPEHSAMQELEYVFPSHPQTGS